MLLFSHSVVSDSTQPPGWQHARLPCPSSPRICSNSCPLNQCCYLSISSPAALFSFCLQSFPAWQSFSMSQFFESESQSIRAWASGSVLPINIQGWFPIEMTGLVSLQTKGLSRVFSSTTIQKYQLVGAQSSLWSNTHICNDYWKNQCVDYTDFCWQVMSFIFDYAV